MQTIELTQGKVALVDDADYPALMQYKWTATRSYCKHRNMNRWYAARWEYVGRNKKGKKKQKKFYMHREIMKCPKGMFVDHKQDIGEDSGLNNQKENLEIVTHSENNYRAFSSELAKTCTNIF